MSPIPALDGLRALAVLLVLLYHAWTVVPHVETNLTVPLLYGQTGVQLFFVLSGFLLFLPYARWLFGLQGRPSAWLFYKRRALRVGPAYWVNLTILVLLTPLSLPVLASALAHVFFLHNVFFVYLYAVWDRFNNVYWTMAVEVQFYVLLPGLAWITHRLTRWVRLVPAVALMVVCLSLVSAVSTILSQRLPYIPHVSPWLINRSGLPFWISVFAVGMACGVVFTYFKQIVHLTPQQHQRLATWGAGILAGGVLLGLGIACVPPLHDLPFKNQLFGLVYGALLLGVLFGPALPRAFFATQPMRFVGLISYSIYLWHQVLLYAIEPHLSAITSVPGRMLASLALSALISVPMAYLSFQLAERPFLQARKRAHELPANGGRIVARRTLAEDLAYTPANGAEMLSANRR